jgi:hypothetical protein
MLDIENIAGICPKAKIVVYFSECGKQGADIQTKVEELDKLNQSLIQPDKVKR